MQVNLYKSSDTIRAPANAIDARTGKKWDRKTANCMLKGTSVNMVLQNQEMKVWHEKDAYYGSYLDESVGFHFFFDQYTGKLLGRLEEYKYEEPYKVGDELSSVQGNMVALLMESSESDRFNFTEKSRVYKVVVKNNRIKIGTLQLDAVFITNPLSNEVLKNCSSRDLINAYTSYNDVCDFRFDYGVGWKQSIKSRNDYYQLFRRRYDLKSIIFAEWLPSAATMFKCFENCFNLEELDISTVQGSATVFTRCFANCKKLKVLKMNKTKNSCRIGGMFSGCLAIEHIEFPFEELSAAKKWRYDTGNITEIKCPLMNGFMRMIG